MYQGLLGEVEFYRLLLQLDEETATQTQALGCWRCGKVLDVADFTRKPRGTPQSPTICKGTNPSDPASLSSTCPPKIARDATSHLSRDVTRGRHQATLARLAQHQSRQGKIHPGVERRDESVRRVIRRSVHQSEELKPASNTEFLTRPDICLVIHKECQ